MEQDIFGPDCKCKLEVAVEDLEEASRLLRASITSDSVDFMANAYALVRAAKVTLQCAIDDYQDHLAGVA